MLVKQPPGQWLAINDFDLFLPITWQCHDFIFNDVL